MSTEQKMTNFEKVGEFHEVFEHPIKKVPDVSIFETSPKIVKLRFALIDEEIREFKEAADANDAVEMVDALADICYVVCGAGHSFGINIDTMLRLVKLQRPNASENSAASHTAIESLCERFTVLLAELSEAMATQDIIACAVSFAAIIEHCYLAAQVLRVDLDYAFALVHDSNMTKACHNEDQATQTLTQYRKDLSTYKDPAIKQSKNGKYWIVFDNATGKTLKSKDYKAVDLRSLVSGA